MASLFRGQAPPATSDARRAAQDGTPNNRRYASPSPSPYAPRSLSRLSDTDEAAASPSMIPGLRGLQQPRRFLNAQERTHSSLGQRTPSDPLPKDDLSQSSTSSERKRTEHLGRSAFSTSKGSPPSQKGASTNTVQPFDRMSPRLPSLVNDEQPGTPETSLYNVDDVSLGAPTPYYYTHNDRTLDKEDLEHLRLQQLLHSSPMHFPRKPPTLSPPGGNSSRDSDGGTGSTDASYGKRMWTVEEDKARIRNAVNGSRIPFRRANGVHLANNYNKVRSNEGSVDSTGSSVGTNSLHSHEEHSRRDMPLGWGIKAKSNPHWLKRSLGTEQNDEANPQPNNGRGFSPETQRSMIPTPVEPKATPRRVSPSYTSFIPRSVSRQNSNNDLAEIADRRLSHSISTGALRESRVSTQNIIREPRYHEYEKYDEDEQQEQDYTQDWEQLDEATSVHEISDLLTADLDKMLDNAQAAIDAMNQAAPADETVDETQELPTLPSDVDESIDLDQTGKSETPVVEEDEGEAIPGTPIVVFQNRVRTIESTPQAVPAAKSLSSDLLRDLARATSQSPSVSPQPRPSEPLKQDELDVQERQTEKIIPEISVEDYEETEDEMVGTPVRAEDTLSRPTPRVAGAWVATPQTVKPKSGLSEDKVAQLQDEPVQEEDLTSSSTSTFEIIPRPTSPLGHKSSSSISGLRQRITKADLLAQSKSSPAIDDTVDSLRDMIENDTDFSSLLNIPINTSGVPGGALIPPFNRTPSLPLPAAHSGLPNAEERAEELALYSMLSDRLRSLKEQIHGARKGVERLEATVDSSLRVPCTSLISHIQTRLQKSRIARLAAGVAIYVLLDWFVSFGFEMSRAAWRSPGEWELTGLDEHSHCDLFPFTTPVLAVRLVSTAAHRVSLAGAWMLDVVGGAGSESIASSWTASVANWWAINNPQNQGENWCWGHDSASLWRWAVRELAGGLSPPS